MHGQWIGKFSYDGDKSGREYGAMLNIDIDREDVGLLALAGYAGVDEPLWGRIDFEKSSDPLQATLQLFDKSSEVVHLAFDGALTAVTVGNWRGKERSGRFVLTNHSTADVSEPDFRFSTWQEFKNALDGNQFPPSIYRGQSDNSWRLRTSFHRTGRVNMIRYAQEDVPRLNRFVTSVLNRTFSLSDALEHGALLNLAQHYGYPTPLLDWTESPYVAAYFAFAGVTKNTTKGFVRIFAFNRELWMETWARGPTNIDMPAPYLSVHELMPILNSRAMPQQSVVLSTNVDDIESWIARQELPNSKYLLKIDIPVSERSKAIRDLSWMGITAASLLPGIEGTCAALKERYF